MRSTVPTGRTAGSAAMIPARALVPDWVLPASQYAVAVTRIDDGAAATARAEHISSESSRTLTRIQIRCPDATVLGRPALRSPPEPPEENDDGDCGDERSPPVVEAECVERGRAAGDKG